MHVEVDAARVLVERIGDETLPVRFLVEGGSVHGIHVRVFPSRDTLPGDQQGRVNELQWAVDPVSWQYLAKATVQWDVLKEQLTLLGVPQVGPGTDSQEIILTYGS